MKSIDLVELMGLIESNQVNKKLIASALFQAFFQ